jgi:hypothetical protein
MRTLLMVGLLATCALAQPESLVPKGLLKEPADRRAMTRYEVVELLDRFLRLYEDSSKSFVTKSELEPVRKAAEAVRDGLQLLDSRIGPLEKDVERLER